MGVQLSRRGYSVRVNGMLLGDSQFVIQAEITYAPHLSKEDRMRLSPMAQIDLLLAVEGEERRARRIGNQLLTGEEVHAARRSESRRAGLFGRGRQPGLAVGDRNQ